MTAAADAPHIGLVVEGSGEFEALPLLLRRWLHEGSDFRDILGSPVLCHGRSKALQAGGIEEKVAVAAARPGCRAVLVVLDGEGDPVCQRGPGIDFDLARPRSQSLRRLLDRFDDLVRAL